MTSRTEQETINEEAALKERRAKIKEALNSSGNYFVINGCDDLSEIAFHLKEERPDDFCIIDLRNKETSPQNLLQETLTETRVTMEERRALFRKQITWNTDELEQPHIVVLGLDTLLSRSENLQDLDGVLEFNQIIDVIFSAQRYSKGGTTMGFEVPKADDILENFLKTGRPRSFRRLWFSTDGFETIE